MNIDIVTFLIESIRLCPKKVYFQIHLIVEPIVLSNDKICIRSFNDTSSLCYGKSDISIIIYVASYE